MCYCDPNVRCICCGAPGCVPPGESPKPLFISRPWTGPFPFTGDVRRWYRETLIYCKGRLALVQTVYSDIHDGNSHTQRAEGERYSMEGEDAAEFWRAAVALDIPNEQPLRTPESHPAYRWGEDCHINAVWQMAWEISR